MQRISPIIFAGATMIALVAGGIIVVNAFTAPFLAHSAANSIDDLHTTPTP